MDNLSTLNLCARASKVVLCKLHYNSEECDYLRKREIYKETPPLRDNSGAGERGGHLYQHYL